MANGFNQIFCFVSSRLLWLHNLASEFMTFSFVLFFIWVGSEGEGSMRCRWSYGWRCPDCKWPVKSLFDSFNCLFDGLSNHTCLLSQAVARSKKILVLFNFCVIFYLFFLWSSLQWQSNCPDGVRWICSHHLFVLFISESRHWKMACEFHVTFWGKRSHIAMFYTAIYMADLKSQSFWIQAQKFIFSIGYMQVKFRNILLGNIARRFGWSYKQNHIKTPDILTRRICSSTYICNCPDTLSIVTTPTWFPSSLADDKGWISKQITYLALIFTWY